MDVLLFIGAGLAVVLVATMTTLVVLARARDGVIDLEAPTASSLHGGSRVPVGPAPGHPSHAGADLADASATASQAGRAS